MAWQTSCWASSQAILEGSRGANHSSGSIAIWPVHCGTEVSSERNIAETSSWHQDVDSELSVLYGGQGFHKTSNSWLNVVQCVQNTAPHHEPLISTPLPDYPWQKVATDLFTLKGTYYLVTVDYFQRYPEVIELRSTTSGGVVEALNTGIGTDLKQGERKRSSLIIFMNY